MPSRSCPHCRQATPRHLPFSSDHSVADYYRCDTCGYVFTIDKTHPDGPIREVTMSEPPRPVHGGGADATL
jgi:transposase-like protein